VYLEPFGIILLPDLLLKFLRASAFARGPSLDLPKSPQRVFKTYFKALEVGFCLF